MAREPVRFYFSRRVSTTMGSRRIVAAPLYRLADWTDDNPVSATGVVIALGALAALLASVALGTGAGGAAGAGGFALDAATATRFASAAAERPAYAAAALLGLAVALLYDG